MYVNSAQVLVLSSLKLPIKTLGSLTSDFFYLFIFFFSVWHDHHHWPGYCVCDDWHVRRSVRDGCRDLSADHHSGENRMNICKHT